MATELYHDGAGVAISSYVGPAVRDEPRTRVQLAVVDADRGGWLHVSLTLTQWAALCDGVRFITEGSKL